MAGLEFKAPEVKEQEDEASVAHNTRIGVIMLVIYVAFYGGFMALSTFSQEIMSRPVLGGVNLAIVYGFALILAAIVFALVYVNLCRKAK